MEGEIFGAWVGKGREGTNCQGIFPVRELSLQYSGLELN